MLLGAIVGFAVGILGASLFVISWAALGFLLLIGSILVVFRVWKKESMYAFAGVVVLASVLGAGRALLAPQALPESLRPLIGETLHIEGLIVSDPDVREVSQRLTVAVEGEETRMLVVAPLYPPVAYGETIRAEGEVSVPEPFDTVGGRIFRYDKFLAKDGIFLVMQNAHVEVIAPRVGMFTQVRGALSDVKFEGLRALAVALPEPYAALAGGLLLGGKQGLGKDLLDDFIQTGLVHVVVLSGYNVMIVADAVFRAFGFLSQKSAAFAAAATIVAFVVSAGAGAASVRAGVMASIALYGRASGRKYDAFRALLLAALLMILWNPLTLAYDPGFQLSFVATLGLIFGAPIVERWLAWVKIKFIKEVAATTIAAQIAVLPLLLYQNGLFSTVALPANIIVLPLVPFAMLASALAGVAGVMVPALAPILAFPAYILLSYIVGVVEMAASIPLAAITVPAFPFWLVILAYTLLIFFVAKFSTMTR